jgi:tetratricopeptide (TPR) repeat protein
MRKMPMLLGVLFVVTLFSMLGISPAQADIEEETWLPPYVKKGYDGFYEEYVVVYKHGSSVNIFVPVKNDGIEPSGLNVSKVIISFDWGQNKTLDLSANIKQVVDGDTEIFTVSFTASATEAVSSERAWEYTIYVEYVNATTGPTEIVDTLDREWYEGSPDYLFVVFSTVQADAYDLSLEYSSYASAYPPSSFSNINASQLAGQASIEAALGSTYYTRGDYASAETQYQTALNLSSQALAAELEWQTKVEEAGLQINLTESEANMATANAMLRQADALLNQSYAWILFGIGFIIMGLGVLVYAYKKPQAAA